VSVDTAANISTSRSVISLLTAAHMSVARSSKYITCILGIGERTLDHVGQLLVEPGTPALQSLGVSQFAVPSNQASVAMARSQRYVRHRETRGWANSHFGSMPHLTLSLIVGL
jgi:hypothetical protein